MLKGPELCWAEFPFGSLVIGVDLPVFHPLEYRGPQFDSRVARFPRE
jgi:hypothetical protein